MIAITGATGHLGRLTIQALLDRGVPAGQIAALVRDPAKASDLAAKGVAVRQADYHQPDALRAALQGADKLLLISSSDFQDRFSQHRNVIDAARDNGVKLIAYTSILGADSAQMLLAADHKLTEAYLRESGLAFVFLRNGWYTENYFGNLAQTLQYGVMLGSAGEGRFTPAVRQDYAAAAAAVLAGEGHDHKVYELGGDEAVTLPQVAAEIGRQSGRPVEYQNLPEEEYAQALVGFGVPAPTAATLADADTALERGDLATESGDLRRLIGRPTTSLRDAVATALKG